MAISEKQAKNYLKSLGLDEKTSELGAKSLKGYMEFTKKELDIINERLQRESILTKENISTSKSVESNTDQ